MKRIEIRGDSLTLADVMATARPIAAAPRVVLPEAARERLAAVRDFIDRNWLGAREDGGEPIYGFNTGVGGLKGRSVPNDRLEEFQNFYIRSHAVGTGEGFPADVVRAAILLRANSLASGYSGVRPVLLDGLCDLLNRGIIPAVPRQGSLGASGDLAPLAHVGSVLIGEPDARVSWPGGEGTVREMRLALPDWLPLPLAAKEAMALTNGTSFMLAVGALLLDDAWALLDMADVAASLSLEAMQGEPGAFDPLIHALRPQPGQQISAANVRRMTEGSGFLGWRGEAPPRVQDAYSLRCVPQVHGASRDAIAYLQAAVERELNAVTDNPLILPEDGGFRAVSGGNFHGQPLALPLDLAAIALAEIGNISERRLFRMLESNLSYGLPPNLTGAEPGLHTGLMIVQYTAAALAAENKLLCHPASVDSIPTSGGQEDHVSLGLHSGWKAGRVAENVVTILSLECLSAAQGIDLARRRVGETAPLGRGTEAVHRAIRGAGISVLGEDRYLKPDIDRARALVSDRLLLRAVEGAGVRLAR